MTVKKIFKTSIAAHKKSIWTISVGSHIRKEDGIGWLALVGRLCHHRPVQEGILAQHTSRLPRDCLQHLYTESHIYYYEKFEVLHVTFTRTQNSKCKCAESSSLQSSETTETTLEGLHVAPSTAGGNAFSVRFVGRKRVNWSSVARRVSTLWRGFRNDMSNQ